LKVAGKSAFFLLMKSLEKAFFFTTGNSKSASELFDQLKLNFHETASPCYTKPDMQP